MNEVLNFCAGATCPRVILRAPDDLEIHPLGGSGWNYHSFLCKEEEIYVKYEKDGVTVIDILPEPTAGGLLTAVIFFKDSTFPLFRGNDVEQYISSSRKLVGGVVIMDAERFEIMKVGYNRKPNQEIYVAAKEVKGAQYLLWRRPWEEEEEMVAAKERQLYAEDLWNPYYIGKEDGEKGLPPCPGESKNQEISQEAWDKEYMLGYSLNKGMKDMKDEDLRVKKSKEEKLAAAANLAAAKEAAAAKMLDCTPQVAAKAAAISFDANKCIEALSLAEAFYDESLLHISLGNIHAARVALEKGQSQNKLPAPQREACKHVAIWAAKGELFYV